MSSVPRGVVAPQGFNPILVNGVRVGVSDHFTQAEWGQIYSRLWGEVRKLTLVPLDQCADPAFLALHLPSRIRSRYLNSLAFYQRTRFKLDLALEGRFKRHRYPFDDLPNTHELRRIFEAHYPTLFVMDTNNEQRRAIVFTSLARITFSFWLAGYGLAPGFGIEAIDQAVLEHALEVAKGKPVKNQIRLLARFLAADPVTSVSTPLVQPARTSVVELEQARWTILLQRYPEAELARMLFDYVFGEHLERTEHSTIRTRISQDDTEDASIRLSRGKIALRTWQMAARSLHHLGDYALSREARTVTDLIAPGMDGRSLLDHYTLETVRPLASNRQYGFRSHVRGWLEWYSDTQNISLNLARILPPLKGRRPQIFGKILHLGAMHHLILTLLDPQTPFIDENDLLQYRCRRAALIQIATGARSESVCLLRQDCLITHDGRTWLRLHKTKPGRELVLEVQADVKRWITEALDVSPVHEIVAAFGREQAADGLSCMRVFANNRNDGPLIPNHINAFLLRLQKRLWPAEHPNGRFFTTHDFRRAKATQMLIDGKDLHDIKEQLGQRNIDSLIPYLATGSPQFQQWFLDIFREGVWSNVSPFPSTSDPITVDAVLTQSLKQTQVTNAEQIVQSFIQEAIDAVGNSSQPHGRQLATIPLEAVGFPRMTHQCMAHGGVNCGHTELDCFSCRDYYRPDADSLPIHLVELFRWMVRLFHSEALERLRKKKKAHTEAFLDSQLVRDKLTTALPILLREKFALPSEIATQVQTCLWNAARSYYHSHGKLCPAPSHKEAQAYLTALDSASSPLKGAWIHDVPPIQYQ